MIKLISYLNCRSQIMNIMNTETFMVFSYLWGLVNWKSLINKIKHVYNLMTHKKHVKILTRYKN